MQRQAIQPGSRSVQQTRQGTTLQDERLHSSHQHATIKTLDTVRRLLSLGQAKQALDHLHAFHAQQPWTLEIEFLRGLCLAELGEFAQAVSSFSKVIEHQNDHWESYVQLAAAMAKLGHATQAQGFLEQALQLFPARAPLVRALAEHQIQAGLLLQAGQTYASLTHSDDCPVETLLAHAQLLERAQQLPQALGLYERVLKKSPRHLPAMNNMANTLWALHKPDAALAVYDRLLKISPRDTTALKNVATIHLMRRDFVQSHAFYRRAYRIQPHERDIAGAYGYAMNFICDWQDHAQVKRQLLADTSHSQARPMTACLFTDDPARLLGHARHLAQTQFKPTGVLGPLPARKPSGKIRLGYFSSDFYTHATVMLIRGLIAAHDRDRFEVHAFSLQPTRHDEGHAQIRPLFDHFHEVDALSDRAVALLSRQLEIDIAIDLKGYTEGCRPMIFAERAAPLQVNFLGYPGSMGADFMDAIIADPYVIPEGQEHHYTERVLRMPHCYQPNDPGRPRPTGNSPRPAELPADAFVFCCFNNTHKITPEVFASWMRILRQTPGSVLWLLKTNDAARENLLAHAVRAGIARDRLVFAPFLPEAEHLERLTHADLFLDTFPYTAHTTASDAVWAGVPVLTRVGESFASRVAGSILHTVGLATLIATTVADYENLALELTNNMPVYTLLKSQLQKKITSNFLYDVKKYSKDFEKIIYDFYSMKSLTPTTRTIM